MSLGYTTEKFIAKAKEVHGDRYDYSLVEYKGSLERIKIICPEHGVFEQVSSKHLRGNGCPKCAAIKPQSYVINKFKLIHGDFYDYSLVKYEGNKTLVDIICPIHGVFKITPDHHIHGVGCKKCAIERRRKPKGIYGFGINDIKYPIRTKVYSTWQGMLKRCYSPKQLSKNPSYDGCNVCEEWRYFSNFKKWFDENYVDGYDLDKDILIKGNKVYSPETCCFVPHNINSLLINCKKARGKYPVGVSKNGNFFIAYMHCYGKYMKLGSFSNFMDAFLTYKKAKEQHIKNVATAYYNEGKITEKVYNALMNYQVEITD